MRALVYIETNWLIGAIMGQDPRVDELINESALRLFVPSVCIMEAVKSFEGKRRDRNELTGHIEKQLSQVRRSSGIAEAQALTTQLQDAKLENDRLLSALYRRLDDITKALVEQAELIHATADDIAYAFDLAFIAERERADMLILSIVTHHAEHQEGSHKALLTDDRGFGDFQPHLDSAGLKLFRSSQAVLGWARSLASE